jgi:pimeloyl-ACP methyl ester carboxylesterase
MLTSAKFFRAFGRIGDAQARRIAEAYWSDPTADRREKYIEACLPLYRTRSTDPEMKRAIVKNDVAMWFNGPRNEHGQMDFRHGLSRIKCPVLVMAGEKDPIAPPIFSEAIAASLPRSLVRFEQFSHCGHGVVPDDPQNAISSTSRVHSCECIGGFSWMAPTTRSRRCSGTVQLVEALTSQD